ncbi:hypothetical protein FS837_010427 [Tulasnella sp. UAMH 9824]|nr:hypothetical protein FS837_010427 [Tulasnella sp. UAMH 9824]
MYNAEVIVARNTLLASCSCLFQDVGSWTLPAPEARSQRQDSLSSGGSSEHYIGEPDRIIPQADAEVFISIITDLARVIADLEESERRGAAPIIESSSQTTRSSGWLEYYTELEKRVAVLIRKWDGITPTAVRNSAKLTGIHQEEAIRKVLQVVRSNNLRQFDERHVEWENRRHPVLASARAAPQSADIPLAVPRSALQLEDARGVSGVIHQSRTPRLYTYEEIELTYHRNEEALEAKRRELERRAILKQIPPLGYMKEVSEVRCYPKVLWLTKFESRCQALEKRLATGLTEPVEPLSPELGTMEAPEPREGCTFTQWLHEIRGCETPVPARTDARISQPPNQAEKPSRMSSPNTNKPLPPTPKGSMESTLEEEAGFVILPRAIPTLSVCQLEGRSEADKPLSDTTTGHWRNKSTNGKVRQHLSTRLADHHEWEGTDSQSRRASNDGAMSTRAPTVTRQPVPSVPMSAVRSSFTETPPRRRASLKAESRPPRAFSDVGTQENDRPGSVHRVVGARRGSRTDRGPHATMTPPRIGLWLQGIREVSPSNCWPEDPETPVSRRSRPLEPTQGYGSPGSIQTRFGAQMAPISPASEYQYRGTEEDAEMKKARLRAKAERLGARTSLKRGKTARERKRPDVTSDCCCCCPYCFEPVSSPLS